MVFRDRAEAGRRLADRLTERFADGLREPVVLALPRGGVPVAEPVARAYGVPVVPFVARKIGAPGHPEFGIGAIAEGSGDILVSDAAGRLGVDDDLLRGLATSERAELDRRVATYRGGAPLPPMEGRDVVLVDDGLATGVTAEAALHALRARHPRRLVFAAPVCAPDSADRLRSVADDVVCLSSPPNFGAVGNWYQNFAPTTDQEVLRLVTGRSAEQPVEQPVERTVAVQVAGSGVIHGDLVVPAGAQGTVVFAHGAGSSRHSPRNRQVAEALRERAFATMLADLLTDEEAQADALTRRHRFDVDLLADRVATVTAHVRDEPAIGGLPLGYFGASTGAAAALIAAADPRHDVRAVVSRGGRPDLAGAALAAVTAPTLLVVGSLDFTVLELNRQALGELQAEARLEVVAGATHLFEEPGALERVSELAGDWFTAHLVMT